LKGHTSDVYSVAFSPDGKMLASGSRDKTIKLWDVSAGKEKFTLKGEDKDILSVAFSPNGKILASGSESKALRLWDVAKGKNVQVLTAGLGLVCAVAFSPDGKLLAAATVHDRVQLWEATTGKKIATLSVWRPAWPGRQWGPILRTVAFSPDGNTLASGGGDKVIKLWDIASIKHIAKNNLKGDPTLNDRARFSYTAGTGLMIPVK
jgi:WD40 repeat protein